MCEYSKFWIESNSYLLFDSKLMQLFEIFEYLFNRDQSGDWHAICCTLPVTSRCTHLMLNPVLHRVCSYPSHSPEHHMHTLLCVRAPSASLGHGIWLHYNGMRQTQRMIIWALDSTLTRRHAAFKVRGDTGLLVLPMWYCRSGSHMPHAVWSAPRMSEKPLQRSYSHA